MKNSKDKIINLLLVIVPIVTIFVIWQIEAVKLNNKFILPELGETIKALVKLPTDDRFFTSLLGTLWRTVLAFIFSFSVATLLAFFSRISKRVEIAVSPLISIMRSLPTIAIILLLLVWTRENRNISPIIVTVLVVLPTIYSSMRDAFFGVDDDMVKALKVFKVPTKTLFLKVYFPSVLPSTLLAIGSGFSLNLKLMVAAEVLSETPRSLGYLLKFSKVYSEIASMMALVIVSVFIGLLIETVFKIISKKVGKWK